MANILNVVQYAIVPVAISNTKNDIVSATSVEVSADAPVSVVIANTNVKTVVFSANANCWIAVVEDLSDEINNTNRILITPNSRHSFVIRGNVPKFVKAILVNS